MHSVVAAEPDEVAAELARGACTTAVLQDPSGESGSFAGQQLEARMRWHVLPQNLAFEVGGALLLRGE